MSTYRISNGEMAPLSVREAGLRCFWTCTVRRRELRPEPWTCTPKPRRPGKTVFVNCAYVGRSTKCPRKVMEHQRLCSRLPGATIILPLSIHFKEVFVKVTCTSTLRPPLQENLPLWETTSEIAVSRDNTRANQPTAIFRTMLAVGKRTRHHGNHQQSTESAPYPPPAGVTQTNIKEM
jgi:hypothetical protein